MKEQGITPLSSVGQLVLMTEKSTGSSNLPSKFAWPCLSRKFIWKGRNLEPAGIVYIGKKLELRLERIMKPLDFLCYITTAVRSFSSFFSPGQVFLTITQPESRGDTLSLAVLAMLGELS